MAAVLLRRMFFQLEKEELLSEIDTDTLKICQAELLVAIETEANLLIQRKICGAVAELAGFCIGKSEHYKYWHCRVIAIVISCGMILASSWYLNISTCMS